MTFAEEAKAFFVEARRSFHAALLDSRLLSADNGIPSIADRHSKLSVEIAKGIMRRLGAEAKGARLAGQMSGNK